MLGHSNIANNERTENGKELVQSCMGVDYNGTITVVLLGKKEGKERKKKVREKRRAINHTLPGGVGNYLLNV